MLKLSSKDNNMLLLQCTRGDKKGVSGFSGSSHENSF